jgi:hypothetical protein
MCEVTGSTLPRPLSWAGDEAEAAVTGRDPALERAGGSGGGARFTRRREDFVCVNCDEPVRGNGYTNHCPRCLWSMHVDVSPGDRAAECGGLMRPAGVLFEGGQYILAHECVRCGFQRRNRSAAGDSTQSLAALMGRPVPTPPSLSPYSHTAPRRPRRGRG